MMGRLEPDGDRCVLTGSTTNTQMYAAEWLAAIPFGFTVEEGPELRAAVAAVAARPFRSMRSGVPRMAFFGTP
jgi:hypothetical protein